MLNKKRNYVNLSIKILLIFLIFSHVLIPLVLGSNSFNSTSQIYNPELEISKFSKDDYKAILNEEKQALGNITINDIDFNELEIDFSIENTSYPLIWEDIKSGALNITQINMQFLNTSEPAIVDNMNENIEDNNILKVILNESLMVELNSPTLGYLIYHSRLVPCRLLQFFVDNGTNVFELNNETDYSKDNDDFIIFNYEDFFKNWPSSEFKMYLIWEYELSIDEWQLNQNLSNDLIIQDQIQNFTVEYHYYFVLTGKKYNLSVFNPIIFADNIDVALTVNLPDRYLLSDHILELNNQFININDYLNSNKTIDISLTEHFSADQSKFSLNFTTSFTFQFIKPLRKTWAIDRLIEEIDIRERIYFPSLIQGPQHIYLKNLSFYEPTIYFEQVLKNSSLFNRNSPYFYLNTSLTGKVGILVKVPYLVVGETCPFIIKYRSTQTLRLIITDNIKMPLVGAYVEVYYYGQKYGTYISTEEIQPITPGNTNENGRITLSAVPYGNYTIRVYHNRIFLKESTASTYNEYNYIYTTYPHFPLWIIIFGGINGIILIFGLIFYLKNKKLR